MKVVDNHYTRVHQHLRSHHKKTGVCDFCKEEKRTQNAKKHDREYTRNIEDYHELCYSCHNRYDCTDEKRAKISKINKGRVHMFRRKPVTAMKDGIEMHFGSFDEAAEKLGIYKQGISGCIRGTQETSFGYTFKLQAFKTFREGDTTLND